MKLTRVHPKMGVEITSCDLKELDEQGVEFILSEVSKNAWTLFRGQSLSDAEIVAFARRIGTGKLEESARAISVDKEEPYVVNLTNLRDENGNQLGYGGNFTDYWHSDQDYRANPATLGILYCLIPSPVGGQTCFASTRLKHLGMEDGDCYQGLRSTRRPAKMHDNNVPDCEISHPVLLKNPVTGDFSAYVSENVIRYIGMEESEGTTLNQGFMEKILAADNIYQHQWRTGDLVVYDNAQLLHRREAFTGSRWLKAAKIFARKSHFAVPEGRVLQTF